MNQLFLRKIVLLTTVVTFTGVCGFAQSKAPGNWPMPTGCYARSYSADHLAKHPQQVIQKIMVKFGTWERSPVAGLQVIAANQGLARENNQGGQHFAMGSECYVEPWPDGMGAKLGWICLSATNSGDIFLSRFDDKMLVFRTKQFVMGESENPLGVLDLAEVPDQWVTYKLRKADDAQCVDWEG